jgi:hypothetical protein
LLQLSHCCSKKEEGARLLVVPVAPSFAISQSCVAVVADVAVSLMAARSSARD